MSSSSLEAISHTREQLTDTVEALVHKLDMSSGLRDKLSATKDMVQTKLGQVTRHLHKGERTVQDNAHEVTRQARSRISHLSGAMRQRPTSAAAVVLTVVVLLLLPRLLHKATSVHRGATPAR